MTATITRISAALILAAGFSASAQAEYRCDDPPSWVDRNACQAASLSPTALRRFVETMNTLRINVQFYDYVNTETAKAWDAQRRQAAAKDTAEESKKLASNAQR
jgi:hypothetical protein